MREARKLLDLGVEEGHLGHPTEGVRCGTDRIVMRLSIRLMAMRERTPKLRSLSNSYEPLAQL